MKQLETLLGWVTVLVFAATGVLALLWVGNLTVAALSKPQPEPAIMVAQVVTEPSVTPDVATPVASDTPATPPAPEPEPAATDAPAQAAGLVVSAEAGEKVFKKCKACHTADEGGKDKTGPLLWGVVGRPAASREGFKYSEAMRARAGEPWDAEALKAFLTKPKDFVPGTLMSFAGLKKEKDILNVIAWLGQQSPNPQSPAGLGLVEADAAGTDMPAGGDGGDDGAMATQEEAIEYEDIPWPEGVTYTNPPEITEAGQQAIIAKVAALEALVPTLDYQRARYHELHFSPAIEGASNEECLVCHQEILDHKPRAASPAGVPADATLAWYQTLDTYEGDQASFHYRHLESDYAKTVMNLQCVFCHKGNDPREESPDMLPTRDAFSAGSSPEFTLRKMVNPSKTCLRCHGAMPDPEEIMGLGGPWHEVRADMEYAEAPNGCLSCHAESYRTNRHNVSYLNALNIEEYARAGSSDSCFGCHGGRAWYRVSYPYPRHSWPLMEDMVGSEVPEWAQGRPTESDPEYALPGAAE